MEFRNSSWMTFYHHKWSTVTSQNRCHSEVELNESTLAWTPWTKIISEISRSGDLDTVLTGISMLQKREYQSVNMVPMHDTTISRYCQCSTTAGKQLRTSIYPLMKMGTYSMAESLMLSFPKTSRYIAGYWNKYEFKQIESPKTRAMILWRAENGLESLLTKANLLWWL